MLIRVVCLVASLSPLLIPVRLLATPPVRSPLQTIKLLHKALREADSATVDSLLHPDYHGISLQGARDQRHIYIETREKAVSDVAGLKPGDWDVRFLSTSTSDRSERHGACVGAVRVLYISRGHRIIVATSPIPCIEAPTDGRSSALPIPTIHSMVATWPMSARLLDTDTDRLVIPTEDAPDHARRSGATCISLRFNSKVRTLHNPGPQ